MRRFCLCVILLETFCFFSEGCTLEKKSSSGNSNSVSLVTWNVQTFFDGVKDGCEYSDFLKTGKWNSEKYLVRLERLSQVITKLNSDVYVFEEIENSGVLRDLCNLLAGNSWRKKNSWSYSCFSKPEGSAIGIGILSKYELSDMQVHSLDVRTQKMKEPELRYLVQVTVKVDGEDLILLANHWKSMSGGIEETEIWRDWQESILGNRIVELKNAGISSAVVMCGDFNRDAGKFICSYTDGMEGNTLLRFGGFGKNGTVRVNSPWFSSDGSDAFDIGSYFFRNQWERIDQIFTFGSIKCVDFLPVAETPWATDEKIPFSYKISNGNGYSDHLPLMCRIIFL